MTLEESPIYFFDDVQVEPRTFKIFKAGREVQVEPKAFSVLLFLIENRRRLVEKNEVLDKVWCDANVTENVLAREIAKLRKTLGDDPKQARYIQTVHTRGYRFVAEVRTKNGNGEDNAERKEPVLIGKRNALPSGATSSEVTPSPAERDPAMATAPVRRFLSPRILALAAALCLVLLATAMWRRRSGETSHPPPSRTLTSVAMLPFQRSGVGKDDEYLGEAIADALVAKLSNSSRLTVLPITSVLHFAGSGLDPLAVGRALKADYVLGGKIQGPNDQLTLEVLRIRDGASLLTAMLDGKASNLFEIEDSFSAKILSTLVVTLDHEETQRFRKRYTQNPEAYEAFLKAHYFMNKTTKEGSEKAIEYFQQAIARDPKYAMAYAGLADCFRRMGRFGVLPAEIVPRSRDAAMKALELDDTVAYAHSMMGAIAYFYDWDFPRADREYQRAVRLEPTLVHQWYASYLLAMNRVPEAGDEYQKFANFLPYAVSGRTVYGHYFYLTHQYDRAVVQLLRTLEIEPDYPPAHVMLGMVYEQQGRLDEAIVEFQKAITLSNGARGWGEIGHLFATKGKVHEAREALRKLDEQSRHAYVSPYEAAVICAALGEREEAMSDLEKAHAERSLDAASLRFDPRLDSLRAEPRFKDFIRRVGLPF